MIKGDFLVWPDADDWYATADALEKLYAAFQQNGDNVGVVRCLLNYYRDQTFQKVRSFQPTSAHFEEDQFEKCLFGQSYWFQPGDYMVKTTTLFENIPNGEIYTEKRAGQNWQLMLPMLYKQRCITVNEHLYNVLERTNSHSRPVNESFASRVGQIDAYQNTIFSTLDRMVKMPDHEREKYKRIVEDRYIKEKYLLSYRKGTKVDQQHYASLVDERNIVVESTTLFLAKHRYISYLLQLPQRIASKVKRMFFK